MEIREAQRTRVKPINVRCFDIGIAQAGKVSVPNIVEQHEQYVAVDLSGSPWASNQQDNAPAAQFQN